jgi:4-hydroxyphenylpyruvate dioxygenase
MFTARSKSCLDFLGVDCVHFYVENATYWRKWFEDCLGFQSLGTTRDRTHTEFLQHGAIGIKISAPIHSSSPVAKYLQNHPAGVGEIDFRVKPQNSESVFGESVRWGDIVHRFVAIAPSEKSEDSSLLRNSLENSLMESQSPLFTHIDHLVLNVPVGEMWAAAHWYEANMGLQIGDRFHIQTERSALKSIVMENSDRSIKIPINEPSTPNSQIQEFLDNNRGAGIQHLALHTNNIFETVATLKQRGVKFLETSPQILIDVQNSETGQALLQIFTQPIFNEPTFFFEIIQRQNFAQGFGEGNFQALFEAIEREQIERKSI